ncbi:MAG: hypothetical protein LUB59_02300, partial [Candidatus Gastranaerophilales bacterium]|nr:hypothetical protein [Candidatus Gastranaerophilales bacterium]
MMNKIDCNKPNNITFGIAFKTYTNSRGVKTGDMLDLSEELKMYDKIGQKLKNDVFSKEANSIVSKDVCIKRDDTSAHPAFRYTDNSGEYFFADDGVALGRLTDIFK